MKQTLSLRKLQAFFVHMGIIFFLPTVSVNAQYYDQTPEFLKANSWWALAPGAGLEFVSTSSVTAWTTSIPSQSDEGHAAVCNRYTGDLLFYTNGSTVWDANGQIMPNGSGLLGNGPGYHSCLQGSLIVPFIGDSTKYYLFSLTSDGGVRTDPNTYEKIGSLFYNVVDITLNGGNGDIDINNKNIVLDTNNLSETLIAVPGCNNDIWVLTHSYTKYTQQPNEYKAYHITENGINITPVKSASKVDGLRGTMAISPNRKNLVFAAGLRPELSEFDAVSGVVRNPIPLDLSSTMMMKPYFEPLRSGVFSPDNTKLYIAAIDEDEINGELIQYDISEFDSLKIDASKQVISRTNRRFAQLRLYNDTIWVSDYNRTNQGSGILSRYHRINQPNNLGTACDLELSAFTLFVTARSEASDLGNQVVFPIWYNEPVIIDTLICSGIENGINLKASSTYEGNKYIWNTGDSTASIEIFQKGVYWVEYGMDACRFTDSFIINGSDLFTTITVDEYQLGTTGGPFKSYQWYLNGEPIPGANQATIAVTENGHYTVEVTDDYGCVFRSDVYEVTNVNIHDIQAIAQSVKMYPNPASDRIYISNPHGIVIESVQLTNILGQIVRNYQAEGQKTIQQYALDALPKGMYMVHVVTTKGIVVFKLSVK